MYSILHISDLHRSPRDNITNDELISALVSDRRRYTIEVPSIRGPDAIVISGDIVQGVVEGVTDAEAALAQQYESALAFIVELADRFVDGDRSRVVIVPGNHDINWATAKSAMQVVPEADFPKNFHAEIFRAESQYRWDWKTRHLFKIADVGLYSSRMDAFWKFFDAFYAGTSTLLRVSREQPSNLYSLWGGRIGIAAFDSCHGNDCFAFHGSIPRDVVARAQLDLLDLGGFELLMAVWHHNIEGPPHRSDYMDIDIVRGMIGRGFRLGLYGHQHRPDATPMQIQLAGRETMGLVSASSLCAGASELPVGATRGYNVVEISDDLKSARVHFREMSIANLFCASRRTALGGASFVDLAWDPPPDLAGRPADVPARRVASIIAEAEQSLRSGHARTCIDLLQAVPGVLPDFGRQLLLEAARKIDDPALLGDLLSTPRSIAELVELVDNYIRRKNYASASDARRQFAAALGMTDVHSKELGRKISAAEAMAL